jgi:LL-diaminopimelate aminotransferase
MAPVNVREVMQREVDQPENRGYADNGIADYKLAAATFMKREFGVELDPERQVNHSIGSKPALAMLPMVFINPGDVTLMTVPGYPVAGTHTRYLGGSVYNLPLKQEHGYLPQLDKIPDDICRQAKLLVINYPNSPTGTLADESFFKEVVQFARQHEVVVVNDAAHILLTYGRRPLSFLSVEGAMDVGVETHSMSKGFHMIGWRLGFVAGNERIVQAFADVKDNCDSGQFIAIQKAGVTALTDASIPVAVREKYERRLSKLCSVLSECGFDAKMPGGTYFLYVKSPRGLEGGETFETAEDASQYLIRDKSICTVPWDDAGAHLRFSVTYQAATEADEDALMAELKSRLSDAAFVW